MNPKRVLGKGLSALIPDAVGAGKLGDKEVRLVPLEAIDFNPLQPRKTFNDNKLQDLAESVRQVGILQPVLLRRWDQSGSAEVAASAEAASEAGIGYRVVAGERRVRAARLAGLPEIPAIICSYAETEALKIALLENIQREDLNPIEEATAYAKLLSSYGATQEELAGMLGKNRSSVANLLRLLTLEPEVQRMVAAGEISRGHAKALLGLPAGPERLRLARLCRKRGLSVRECEHRVRLVSEARPKRSRGRAGRRAETAEVRALRERTERILGSPVRIERDPRTGKGSLQVRFFSDADLERLLEIIGVNTDLS